MRISPYLIFLALPFLAGDDVKRLSNPAIGNALNITSDIKTRNYSGFTVVVDPGHGGEQSGACHHGVVEKDVTLETAMFLKEYLEEAGVTVFMTRENDSFVSLEDRVKFSDNIKPDIFVSIHYNSVENPYKSSGQNGLETFYPLDSKYSKELATDVHEVVVENLNLTDRFTAEERFYVIRKSKSPSILIEGGYLTNPQDRQLLTENKRKYAKAIRDGILDYFDERLEERLTNTRNKQVF